MSCVEVIKYGDGWWIVRMIGGLPYPLAGPYTSREAANTAAKESPR